MKTKTALGDNAMLAMAAIVQGIYGIPSASVGDARINVGQVIAGSGRNVVCDRVKMVMELRGLNQASLDYLQPYAERIIHHACAMHGCTAEIKLMGATPSLLIDSPELVEQMVTLAKNLGFRVEEPKPDSTSEDFAYMAQRVQEHGGKTLYFLCKTNYPAPGHAVTYDLDENDLTTGVKFFCAAITKLMGLTE